MAALEAANVIISQAISSATQVLQETQNLLSNVNDLTQKYNYLLFASSNVTNAIREGQAYGKFNSAGIYMLWNAVNKVWNMFRVNNKDTKTTPMESIWCFYC